MYVEDCISKEIVVCRRWIVQRDLGMSKIVCPREYVQRNVMKIGCMSNEVCPSEYVRGNVLGDRRMFQGSRSGGMFQRD